MPPSSVFFKIAEIRENNVYQRLSTVLDGSVPYDYQVGFDEEQKICFISATIRPDILDKGFEPTLDSKTTVKLQGTVPGDLPGQYIGIKLGGGGHDRNIFPLNEQLDTSKWRADQDTIYDYLKVGGDRHARLMYGMEYKDHSKGYLPEWQRPLRIHYHFQLYENGKAVGQAIEDTFENTSSMKL